MNTNTKDVMVSMAKEFYNTKFQQFDRDSLGNVIDEFSDRFDREFSINILNKVNKIIFSGVTTDEISSRLPDISYDDMEEVKGALLYNISLAASSIILTRAIASVSYALYGFFASFEDRESKSDDEIIAEAKLVIEDVIANSRADGLRIAETEARDKMKEVSDSSKNQNRH